MWWRTSTSPTPPATAPPVIDHRQLPPGVLPRQLQLWVMVGVALVMVGIMAVAGRPTRPPATATAPSAPTAAIDPNQPRIASHHNLLPEPTPRPAAAPAPLPPHP